LEGRGFFLTQHHPSKFWPSNIEDNCVVIVEYHCHV